MSILTGNEILQKRAAGDIVIEPFNLSQLNPNSYNLRLGNRLLTYSADNRVLDPKKDNTVEELIIPESGLPLWPGRFYLGTTDEWTETDNLVPMLDGRSSTGRLGLMVHVTAGFGDVGFKGRWTLEIKNLSEIPIIVYPGMEICQISYYEPSGEILQRYTGKYQGQDKPEPSLFFEDYK